MSIYDPSMWDEKTPANVIGGRNRSRNAVRDSLGRFMPSTVEAWENWKLDTEHGRAGGLKTLQKYGREYYRQIRAKRKQS